MGAKGLFGQRPGDAGPRFKAAATQAYAFSFALKQRNEIPIDPEKRKAPPVIDPAASCVWYALIAAPMTESKVEDELAKMGFTLTYVPRETYWTSRLVQNRTIKTERQKPLIPRYVFLAIGSEVAPWYEISLVQDIVGVLSIAGIPRPVPARELARIATMEKQGWFDDRKRLGLELAAGRPIFEEGDQVRITGENAFAGLEALLAADSTTDSRVNLLVSMFGRMTPIVLPMSDIELVKAKRNRLLTEGGL